MILVTRLDGGRIAVNADMIERAEADPETVLTLVDGTRYTVIEPLEEIIAEIRNYRASILVAAKALEDGPEPSPIRPIGAVLRVVHDPPGNLDNTVRPPTGGH